MSPSLRDPLIVPSFSHLTDRPNGPIGPLGPLEARNKHGETALGVAVRLGQRAVACALLDRGASPAALPAGALEMLERGST